jgi:hypothetical protein
MNMLGHSHLKTIWKKPITVLDTSPGASRREQSFHSHDRPASSSSEVINSRRGKPTISCTVVQGLLGPGGKSGKVAKARWMRLILKGTPGFCIPKADLNAGQTDNAQISSAPMVLVKSNIQSYAPLVGGFWVTLGSILSDLYDLFESYYK